MLSTPAVIERVKRLEDAGVIVEYHASVVPTELSWILNDYPAGWKEAQRQGKPIFIDFTGYTCTNCRWIEANMFLRPEIRAELGKYVLVRLFTDASASPTRANGRWRRIASIAWRYLGAILTPSGQIKASFPGLTRDSKEFL